jgi:hypothetical protein
MHRHPGITWDDVEERLSVSNFMNALLIKEETGGEDPFPPEGLVLWNKLGSAEEVETSEYGPNLIENGSDMSYVPAKFGNGLNANPGGRTSEVYAPSWQAIFNNKYAFTFECWIKLNNWYIIDSKTSDSKLHVMVQTSNDDTSEGGYGIFDLSFRSWGICVFYSDGTIGYGGSGIAAEAYSTSGINRSLGSLVHIAASYEFSGGLGKMKFYMDGELITDGTPVEHIDGINYEKDWKFHIGDTRDNYSDYYFNNVIDNVKIWNYAKTDFSDRNTEGF